MVRIQLSTIISCLVLSALAATNGCGSEAKFGAPRTATSAATVTDQPSSGPAPTVRSEVAEVPTVSEGAGLSARLECVGAQWASDGHELVQAEDPAEASDVFAAAAGGDGPDSDAVIDFLDSELISPRAEPRTVIERSADSFRATNFRENSSPSFDYTVSWQASDAGYVFSVSDTDDYEAPSEQFTLTLGEVPGGELAALAAIDNRNIRDEPELLAETAVRPFQFQDRTVVLLTWWKDPEDGDGELLACSGA